MQEIWKDIEGYEGYYQVSNLGRVKSLERKTKQHHNSVRTQPERILKSWIKRYESVILCKDSKTKKVPIHRLVAKAFLPNENNLPEVNHKDENKLNNCADNLEWCTREYNINYGTAIERKRQKLKGRTRPRNVDKL